MCIVELINIILQSVTVKSVKFSEEIKYVNLTLLNVFKNVYNKDSTNIITIVNSMSKTSSWKKNSIHDYKQPNLIRYTNKQTFVKYKPSFFNTSNKTNQL